MLISVDPGLTGTGIAVWDEHAQLDRALVVSCTTGAIEQRIATIREEIRPHVSGRQLRDGVDPHQRLVIEVPQTYGGRAKKGDANSLLRLAELVGSITSLSPRVERVLPREWKRGMPDRIVKVRCLERLSSRELQRVDLDCSKKHQTDVWAAIGLGLWWLRRHQFRR